MKKPNFEMRSVSSAGDWREAAVERKEYPIRAEEYMLLEVGQGVSASVCRALCIPFDEVVAIKILDFERNNSDLVGVCRVRHAGLSTESGRVQVRSISKPDRVRPEELVEEIARVVGDGREDIEEENLQRMSYLKAE